FGLGRAAVFLELPRSPAAGHDEPRPPRPDLRRRAKTLQRFGERPRADPMHFGLPGEAGANGMDMGIDQAGNDGATAEVDDARGGARHLAYLRRAADRRDFSVTHRQRADARRRVKSRELAV